MAPLPTRSHYRLHVSRRLKFPRSSGRNRSRRSTKRLRASKEGEHERAKREHEGAEREHGQADGLNSR